MKTSKLFLSILSLFMLCTTGLKAQVCERLDAKRADSTFVSFMVDDIDRIVYQKSNAGDEGYSVAIVVPFVGDPTPLPLSEFVVLQYEPIGKAYQEIAREFDEHAPLVMLDCINNNNTISNEKPVDWTAQRPYGKVHFVVRNEPGYESTYEVVGQYTGKVYTDNAGFVFWEAPEDNHLGQDALTFFMPNEPVTIRVVSKELTTYEGYPFVGKYTGFGVTSGNGLLAKTDAAPFSLELKANTSCHVSSTDAMAYSFVDVYTYEDGAGGFKHYVEELAEDEKPDLSFRDQPAYGVNGTFFANDFIFCDIHDYNNDKHENTRYYLICKNPCDYVCAQRDASAYMALMEATDKYTGAKHWFFLSNYGINTYRATVDFVSGTTIGEPCEAFVTYNGTVQYKYVLADGGDPQFIAKGKEAGTFLSTDATGYDIKLDGFGTATIEGKEYPYTVESTVVTVTLEDGTHVYTIDIVGGTYTEVVSSDWNGAASYSNDHLEGRYLEESATLRNTASIVLDQNLVGTAKPGYAAISVNVYRGYDYISAVSDCQKYIYDTDAKTLTITNVLQGDGEGGTHRANLVFQLSDDLQKMWLAGDDTKIYATSYAGSYVSITQDNPLEAPVIVIVPLEDHYTAKLTATYYDSPVETTGELFINQDASGNAKEGYATLKITAMGSDVISSCVPYTYDNNVLTLKGVTVGDGNYGTTTADIVFNVTPDGRVQGTGTYYGTNMTTAFMQVDLASDDFVPAMPGDELAAKYTGKYYLGTNDDDGTGNNPTVDATLTIDRDANGNLKAGYAYFLVRMAAGKFGDKSVPYELANGQLVLKGYGLMDDPAADLVFTINSDGTLQATGKLQGMYSTMSAFYVDLSKAALSPAE